MGSDRAAVTMEFNVIALVLMFACGGSPQSEPASVDSTGVVTLSAPIDYFTDRLLSGSSIKVTLLLPSGESPSDWSPNPDVIASLASAELIISHGADFEPWIKTATLPKRKVFAPEAGIDWIELSGGTHSHGSGGEHSHVGKDPYIWSDPLQVSSQVSSLAGRLSFQFPQHKELLANNLSELKTQLAELATESQALLKTQNGSKAAANHPSFNYLARANGIALKDFSISPNKAPESVMLAKLTQWLNGETQPLVLWDSTPEPSVVDVLPEYAVHITLDDLSMANASSTDYNYVEQFKANLGRIKSALDSSAPSE